MRRRMMRILAVRVPVTLHFASTIGLMVAVSGCRTEQAYEKPLVPVKISPVQTFAAASDLKYSGSVTPQSRTDLAFRVPGYVRQLATVRDARGVEHPIGEGDTVTAGTVLANLRDTDYVVKVNQARSALDQARAGVDQARAGLAQARSGLKAAEVGRDKAKLDFDRATNLFNTQSLTKTDLDGAKAALDAAQANVDAAQASVDGVQTQIVQGEARVAGAQAQIEEGELAVRDCALIAPAAGVVLKRGIEIGTVVGPGVPVFSIMDVSSVKVVFGAPDVLVGKLRIGQELPATTESLPNVRLAGRITSIAPAADANSRVFEIEVTIPNRDGRLRPGMIATIDLQSGAPAKALPVVPLPAVGKSAKDPKAYSVFVIDRKDGHDYVRERAVRLGDPLGIGVAVLDGLNTGENVVISGNTLVRDGDQVQIVP